jgi:hypothetical protein
LSHKEELFRSRDDAHLAMRAAVAAAVERVEAVAATQQREERAQTEVLLNELKQGHAAEMAKSRHRAADALAAMEAIKEGEASRDALARHRRMADDAALVAAVETEAAVEDAKKRAIEDMERKHQRVLREEREAFEQQIAKERAAAEAATVEAANAAVQYNEKVEHARQTRARTRQELATAEETREAREARSEHLDLARCVESMQATVSASAERHTEVLGAWEARATKAEAVAGGHHAELKALQSQLEEQRRVHKQQLEDYDRHGRHPRSRNDADEPAATAAAAAVVVGRVVGEAAGYRVGGIVEAKVAGWTKYYAGKITRANSDGTFDIKFDDGEQQSQVSVDRIKGKSSGGKNEGGSWGRASTSRLRPGLSSPKVASPVVSSSSVEDRVGAVGSKHETAIAKLTNLAEKSEKALLVLQQNKAAEVGALGPPPRQHHHPETIGNAGSEHVNGGEEGGQGRFGQAGMIGRGGSFLWLDPRGLGDVAEAWRSTQDLHSVAAGTLEGDISSEPPQQQQQQQQQEHNSERNKKTNNNTRGNESTRGDVSFKSNNVLGTSTWAALANHYGDDAQSRSLDSAANSRAHRHVHSHFADPHIHVDCHLHDHDHDLDGVDSAEGERGKRTAAASEAKQRELRERHERQRLRTERAAAKRPHYGRQNGRQHGGERSERGGRSVNGVLKASSPSSKRTTRTTRQTRHTAKCRGGGGDGGGGNGGVNGKEGSGEGLCRHCGSPSPSPSLRSNDSRSPGGGGLSCNGSPASGNAPQSHSRNEPSPFDRSHSGGATGGGSDDSSSCFSPTDFGDSDGGLGESGNNRGAGDGDGRAGHGSGDGGGGVVVGSDEEKMVREMKRRAKARKDNTLKLSPSLTANSKRRGKTKTEKDPGNSNRRTVKCSGGGGRQRRPMTATTVRGNAGSRNTVGSKTSRRGKSAGRSTQRARPGSARPSYREARGFVSYA